MEMDYLKNRMSNFYVATEKIFPNNDVLALTYATAEICK